MSFWAILAGCFSASKPPARPYAQVTLNSVQTPALFDTGSTYTLVNSRLKSTILGQNHISPGIKHVQLCAANGDALKTKGSYSIDISFSNRTIKHPVIFVDCLQVDCIVGMDFMSTSNISIDTKRQKIILGKKPQTPVLTLFSKKSILLPPNSETMGLSQIQFVSWTESLLPQTEFVNPFWQILVPFPSNCPPTLLWGN